jgi:hypothetical protein
MWLGQIESKPAETLKALLESKRLLEESGHSLMCPPINELIGEIKYYIEQLECQSSAVKEARTIAQVLLNHGGEAARDAIDVPLPHADYQTRLRESDPEDAHLRKLADGLNRVGLDVPDDAMCAWGGAAGIWVSAWIFVPIAHQRRGQLV